MSNTIDPVWILTEKKTVSQILGAAIHDGHVIRPDLLPFIALSKSERLREEDPFTGEWARVAGASLVGTRSRFEVDLNRPRDLAIYRTPEDAWGLKVFKEKVPEEIIDASLAEYDAFYEAMKELFARTVEAHDHFVVLDIHSYNHRREGPDATPADSEGNPEVNLEPNRFGTGRLFNPSSNASWMISRVLTTTGATLMFGKT